MKNYIRLFLTTVFVTFVLNVAQAEQTVPKDIMQAHETVWKIVHPDGHEGTAFFTGPNQIVTHVYNITGVGKSKSRSNKFDAIYLEKGEQKLKLRRVLNISAVNGLAVLETEGEVSNYLNISKGKPLGRLFALGYSFGGAKQTLIHSEEYGVFDNGDNVLMAMDKSTLPLSGSPVLDDNTEIVGVVFSGVENMLGVIKVSQLEKLQGGSIGLDCSKVAFSLCIEQAIEELKERADQEEEKDPIAKENLAAMYYYGREVKQDLKEAFSYWSEAAELGYAPAQYGAAIMSYNGYGVDQDQDKAIDLWFKAADQGYAPAQYEAVKISLDRVLDLHENEGEGVEDIDIEKILTWMIKSAEQGYAPAQEGLEEVRKALEGIQVD